jgi:hypothetical protein
MAKIIKIKRKPRPLRATYQPKAPYQVEREDWDDGTIAFHVTDMRPDTYRTVVTLNDNDGMNPFAKHDAEQIARGLNLLVQYGMEQLPNVRDPHNEDDAHDR